MNDISTNINLAEKIGIDNYPCVMAKATLNNGNIHMIQATDIKDLSLKSISETLKSFYRATDEISSAKGFHSIVIEFDNISTIDEEDYEASLWSYLQALHSVDSINYPWDKSVSSDPSSEFFSFSLKSKAFYIIGMHPSSSRKARQSKKPCIIFNLHAQFEELRSKGNYEKIRDNIRRRDIAYSGSINPMVTNFGDSSEALQYSGRKNDKSKWKCPFHALMKN